MSLKDHVASYLIFLIIVFFEKHAMDGINKQRMTEFKSDPWSQQERTGKDVTHWNHRVLFPTDLLG